MPGYNAGGPIDPVLAPLQNLAGARPIPPQGVVQWSNLFEVSGRLGDPAGPRPARKIDSRLSFPLSSLPRTALASAFDITSLAERNLLRGKRLGLPSGQQVARAMGVPPLPNTDPDPTRPQLGLTEAGWGGEAPLWFYVLKEAELLRGGERLGPVGGRIVAEVLLGLLERDTTSYLSAPSGFQPAPPIAPARGEFTMADLLRFIGAS